MKCLRCGHCCIEYSVMIIIDPEKGLTEDNVEHKNSGIKCRHLVGEKPGEYSCAIHDHEIYKSTPCFDFTQIEKDISSFCRMGNYILTRLKNDKT